VGGGGGGRENVCVLVCEPMRVCVRACPCVGKNKEKKEGKVLIKRILRAICSTGVGRYSSFPTTKSWAGVYDQLKPRKSKKCVFLLCRVPLPFPCLNFGMQIQLRSFLQSRVHAAAKALQEWLEVAIDSSLKKHSMYTLVHVEKYTRSYKNTNTCIVDKGPAHPKRMSAHRYLKSCK